MSLCFSVLPVAVWHCPCLHCTLLRACTQQSPKWKTLIMLFPSLCLPCPEYPGSTILSQVQAPGSPSVWIHFSFVILVCDQVTRGRVCSIKVTVIYIQCCGIFWHEKLFIRQVELKILFESFNSICTGIFQQGKVLPRMFPQTNCGVNRWHIR